MSYLLHTCVLSEATRREPNINVMAWLERADESRLYLSVLMLGEVQQGTSRQQPSRKQRELQSWLEQDLLQRFRDRLLDVDVEVALEWGRLQGEARAKGNLAPVVDSLLAATAIRHNLTLVTRNVVDFERFGVKLLNPFEP